MKKSKNQKIKYNNGNYKNSITFIGTEIEILAENKILLIIWIKDST